METYTQPETYTQIFIALFISTKNWKWPRCPLVGEQISETWCLCTSTTNKKILLSDEKVHTTSSYTNMNKSEIHLQGKKVDPKVTFI